MDTHTPHLNTLINQDFAVIVGDGAITLVTAKTDLDVTGVGGIMPINVQEKNPNVQTAMKIIIPTTNIADLPFKKLA
jgi:hypothetical protein